MKKSFLAKNLRKRRNQLGWTQEKSATEISFTAGKYVDRTTYLSWESGRSHPKVEMLIAITEVFQVDDLYLFISKLC
jgi:transcriptional regulator with XRE-family HTH domain